MRKQFAQSVLARSRLENTFFLTGDLGFMALEEVEAVFGDRFVNAGVAEQNMIGIAAGLAREGYDVFAYSIAPFCYARPYEQIRNDICFSGLPVCLVGNGGGYAYGHMGPTHHALEDCAAMTALGVRVLVPAFDEDIAAMIENLTGPTYLRLGYDARPGGTAIAGYAPWREVLAGSRGILATLGPLAGVAWQALGDLPVDERPAVWAITEFGSEHIPQSFWDRLQQGPLYVIEEHVAAGGLGMHVAYAMAARGIAPKAFIHRHAVGYPTGRYGSQQFHRAQCGLDGAAIRAMVTEGE